MSKKNKDKLRKIAYKNKMTMSEYVRNLVSIDILKHTKQGLNNRLASTNELILLKSLREFIND
jgi:hypothetical protein